MDTKVTHVVEQYAAYSSNLVNSANSLLRSVKVIETFVHDYDFNETTKFNGFRSLIKLIDRLFTLLLENSPKTFWLSKIRPDRAKQINELARLTYAVDYLTMRAIEFHEKLLEQSKINRRVNSKSTIESVFILDLLFNFEKKCEAYRMTHLANMFISRANFYYTPLYRLFLNFFTAMTALMWMRLSPSSVTQLILSPNDFIAKQVMDLRQHFDLAYFYPRFDWFVNFIGSSAIKFARFSAHRKKKITFAVPQVWKITRDARIERMSNSVMTTVKTTMIFSSFDEKNESLVLHIHGGAFLFGSPDTYETCIAIWAKGLRTIPVLSVEYSCGKDVHFPTALQELLNIYLFLTSGEEEVKKILKFHPKKITFAGDSAGGNLSLALTCLANDLRRQYDASIKLPVSILSIYSANLLQPIISPSRMFTMCDAILPSMVFFEFVGEYMGFKGRCEHWTVPDENNNQTDDALKIAPSHWYQCDQCLSEYERFNNSGKSPYLSPLLYEHFDQLADVTLNSIVGEFDPLLDENIALCKLWKGKVTLDVFSEVGHGFVQFPMVSKKTASSYDLCIKRLHESLREPDDLP